MSITIDYNESQLQLHNAIVNSNEKKIIVTGDGGTGKTYTIINSIIDLIQENSTTDKPMRALVLAPTHQAKRVLHEKFIDNSSAKVAELVTFSTVAAAFQKYGIEDKTYGNINFIKSPSLGKAFQSVSIIYIDEVSMLAKRDIDFIMNWIDTCNEKNLNIRIILSGDAKQLPPVMDTRSSILDNPTHHLSEPMRTNVDAHGIRYVANQLRDDDNWFKVLRDNALNEFDFSDVIAYQTKTDLLEEMSKYPIEDIAYLTYTNKDANYVGYWLREIEYGIGADEFKIGERLSLKVNCPAGHVSDIVTITDIISYHKLQAPTGEILSYALLNVSGVYGNKQNLAFFTIDSSIQVAGIVAKLQSTIRANNGKDDLNYLGFIEDVRDNFITWSFPYARTIHSSQGQSIPYVFFDSYQICGASNQQKLFYVAASRACKELHYIPAPKDWTPKANKILVGKNEWSETINAWRAKFGYSHQNSRFLPFSVNGNAQRKLILDILKEDLEKYADREEFDREVMDFLKSLKKDWTKYLLPIYKEDANRVLYEEIEQAGIKPNDLLGLESFMITTVC